MEFGGSGSSLLVGSCGCIDEGNDIDRWKELMPLASRLLACSTGAGFHRGIVDQLEQSSAGLVLLFEQH